ncbi:MAG: hypothetical protein ACFFDS_02725 [Candidatus Thorarchaeota archaeon]
MLNAIIFVGNLLWSFFNTVIIIIGGFLINKEIAKLKSSLTKTEFIHKLQFNKEFEIYEELWKHLDNLQKLMVEAGINLTKEWKDNVNQTYKAISSKIRENKPFYDEEVFKNANKILLHSNIIDYMTHHPQSEEVSNIEEVNRRKDEVDNLINNIEKAIRTRIHNIGSAKLIE